MLTLQAPIDTTHDEALEKGYDIIKSIYGRREPPLELEVCSETINPPNHRDYETSSLVNQFVPRNIFICNKIIEFAYDK